MNNAAESDMNHAANLLPQIGYHPLYEEGEHIFYLLVGSQDQEAGLHRGQIENVLLPGEPGNNFAQHEIVYLVSRTGTIYQEE